MKKYIIIVIAAIVAAITLCSATSSPGDSATKGTVQFESAAIPALNFVMPLSRAQDIFRLMPDTITTLCVSEYEAVRSKCNQASRFTHEGVSVQWTGKDPDLTISFAVSGYKLTVSDVSWGDLDVMFAGSADN